MNKKLQRYVYLNLRSAYHKIIAFLLTGLKESHILPNGSVKYCYYPEIGIDRIQPSETKRSCPFKIAGLSGPTFLKNHIRIRQGIKKKKKKKKKKKTKRRKKKKKKKKKKNLMGDNTSNSTLLLHLCKCKKKKNFLH